MKNRGTNGRQGFTLIELLVVISIISLLIAILLPALASARMSAMQIQCGSGLKQIGVAFAVYGEDNEQYFPHPRGTYKDSGGSLRKYDTTAPNNARFNWYIGRYIDNNWWQDNRDNLARYFWHQSVQCPERDADKGNHFGMVNQYEGYYWQVINQSQTILIGDAKSYFFMESSGGNFQYRHMDRAGNFTGNLNLLMGDMHVKTIPEHANLLVQPWSSSPMLVVKRQ
ncbi:MAG: hypothetical protein CMJ19_18205 [Phycisphaeraceae bacterium]|nr:hypothetical protein [Phycisphaeraceae bacterium]